MKKYLLLCLLLPFAACDRFDEMVEEDDDAFEATVLGYGDCNLVQLSFRIEDEDSLREITGADGVTYHAINYTKILFQSGQKLLVKVRKLTDDELPACPTFAPTYPALLILHYRVVE